VHVPNDDRLFPGRLETQIGDFGDDDSGEWVIDRIASHVGSGRTATFEVIWRAGDRTWVEYDRIKRVPGLLDYLELQGAESIDTLQPGTGQPPDDPQVFVGAASYADDELVYYEREQRPAARTRLSSFSSALRISAMSTDVSAPAAPAPVEDAPPTFIVPPGAPLAPVPGSFEASMVRSHIQVLGDGEEKRLLHGHVDWATKTEAEFGSPTIKSLTVNWVRFKKLCIIESQLRTADSATSILKDAVSTERYNFLALQYNALCATDASLGGIHFSFVRGEHVIRATGPRPVAFWFPRTERASPPAPVDEDGDITMLAGLDGAALDAATDANNAPGTAASTGTSTPSAASASSFSGYRDPKQRDRETDLLREAREREREAEVARTEEVAKAAAEQAARDAKAEAIRLEVIARADAQRERDRANAATVRNLAKLTVSKSGPPEALKLSTGDTHRAIIERLGAHEYVRDHRRFDSSAAYKLRMCKDCGMRFANHGLGECDKWNPFTDAELTGIGRHRRQDDMLRTQEAARAPRAESQYSRRSPSPPRRTWYPPHQREGDYWTPPPRRTFSQRDPEPDALDSHDPRAVERELESAQHEGYMLDRLSEIKEANAAKRRRLDAITGYTSRQEARGRKF
jgi:hypothetical protein